MSMTHFKILCANVWHNRALFWWTETCTVWKIVWFSYKRDFLTLSISPMGQKLAGIIFPWGIARYAYISCGKDKLTHFWEDKSKLTYVQGKAQGTILVYTVYTSSLLQKTAEKPLFGNHVQSNCPISLI